MTRIMVDAISANASKIISYPARDIQAIYLTGSPDIRWTRANVASFPHEKTWVRIDQGGATSPQYEADVCDVETGAYTVAHAQLWVKHCTAARPTIYCNQSTLTTLGWWTGDIWLAAPGWSAAQCVSAAAADKRIVAVQNLWATDYDSSVVTDPYWPAKHPIPGQPAKPVVNTVQWEYYKPGFGWVLPEGGTTTLPAESTAKARMRVSNGEWSGWTEVTGP